MIQFTQNTFAFPQQSNVGLFIVIVNFNSQSLKVAVKKPASLTL